jgi:type I restriction enzyme M protein
VVATWWGDALNDLKGLSAQGFRGLVEAWATSIRAGLEDEGTKDNPLDHPLTKALLPKYLADIAECEAKKAELDATIKGAQPGEDEEEAEEAEEKLSEDEVSALKKELGVAKRKLKALLGDFVQHLDKAVAKLDGVGARDLVLGILRAQLDGILGRYVSGHRQQVTAAFNAWWDKYNARLVSIEAERDAAAVKLRGFLEGLGYGA